MSRPMALAASGVRKSFGGVEVLHGVDLHVPAGEVHGLLGQNGCGKSTLVKAITGVHAPDAGHLVVHGREVPFPVNNPRLHGISVIHQDVGLVDSMTVLDNVSSTVGFGTRSWLPIPTGAERRRLETLMDTLQVSLDLDASVSTLSAAQRTFVGMLRSLRALDGRGLEESLFILDEPTTSLPAPEALLVTGLMRRVADAGGAVVFISHRLGEVLEVCDSATILRSGEQVFSGSLDGMDAGTLTEVILGRRMETFYPRPTAPQGDRAPALVVEGLRGRQVRDVSFTLHPGEVLGVTGLMGMGQEELPELLAGGIPRRAGTVQLSNGVPAGDTLREVIAQGMVLVPANRVRDNAWVDASARENLTLPRLQHYATWRGIDEVAERTDVQSWMTRLGTVPAEPERRLSGFSGGNQQKVVTAKWLAMEPDVMLLDEPTQGVDAGAKHDLLEVLLERARDGAALVIFSGDHDQLAHVCTRVLVLVDGRVAHEVTGSALSEENLMRLCNDF